MAYTILTAAEAAAMIKNNENIALSGFIHLPVWLRQ